MANIPASVHTFRISAPLNPSPTELIYNRDEYLNKQNEKCEFQIISNYQWWILKDLYIIIINLLKIQKQAR